MDKVMKAEIEEIFFDYHIRGCELADEKSNRICEQRKQQDIKEITALIIKWLESKRVTVDKYDDEIALIDKSRNQLITELVEELK